jgi:hypothetical protein
MKLYKLTDKNDRTHGGCQWGENVTIETSGEGDLCGPGWTHWYLHPLLAVFLNPIHGDFNLKTAHLWEGRGKPEKFDYGLKVGCRKATTIKRINLPKPTTTQRVAFGILAALEVYHEPSFVAWAKDWLANKNRNARAAEAAAWATDWAAAWADWAAAWAATWAAKATEAAEAAGAAEAAAWAAITRKPIDLIKIAKKAMKY